MPSETKIVLVGIAGATRAGKTSLARSLEKKYPGSIVLHADRYWQVKKPYSEEVGEYNWEVPDAVDYVVLNKAIDGLVAGIKKRQLAEQSLDTIYIIVEGFLLFADDATKNRFDIKMFITIDQETCFTRRMTTKTVPVNYFQLLLWPSFVKYSRPMLEEPKLLILDSKDTPETLIVDAMEFMEGKEVASKIETHRSNIDPAKQPDMTEHFKVWEAKLVPPNNTVHVPVPTPGQSKQQTAEKEQKSCCIM